MMDASTEWNLPMRRVELDRNFDMLLELWPLNGRCDGLAGDLRGNRRTRYEIEATSGLVFIADGACLLSGSYRSRPTVAHIE